MLNRNNKKDKQLLQIDVDSEEDYLHQQEQVDDEQQEQQEQSASDNDDSDDNSQQYMSQESLDSNNNYDDDQQQQGNSSQQEQSQFHGENYQQQSSSFNHQQSHLQSINSHTFSMAQKHSAKYKSTFNEQEYLIIENQSNVNNSLSLYPPQTTNKDVSGLLTQQNDKEVDKIIQEVLYKRKHKQKQKQLIENIINSQRNHNFVNQLSNKDQSTTRLQFIDPTFRKGKQQQIRLKSYASLMKKCKQLEIKINKMTKKQLERQKLQSNKQPLKQKKQKLMSKKELSLEKLKKRLEKALSLNTNLSKRVKLQKSQLASICTMKSHSYQLQQPTINQQSTIKGTQNVSLMSKNGQKYCEDTFRSYSKNSEEQLSIVGLSREKRKCAQKSQQSKEKKKIANNKRLKELVKNKTSSSVEQQISSFSPSPAIYKSPILQFNSYLIDESQYKSPLTNKENIYIEDDMNSLSNQQYLPTFSHSNDKKNQANQRMFEQLKALMGQYLALEGKEKSLQQSVDSNSMKIKEYENEHYNKIVGV